MSKRNIISESYKTQLVENGAKPSCFYQIITCGKAGTETTKKAKKVKQNDIKPKDKQ